VSLLHDFSSDEVCVLMEFQGTVDKNTKIAVASGSSNLLTVNKVCVLGVIPAKVHNGAFVDVELETVVDSPLNNFIEIGLHLVSKTGRAK